MDFQTKGETKISVLHKIVIIFIVIFLYSMFLINYVDQAYVNKKSLTEFQEKLMKENVTKSFQRISILLWNQWWKSDSWWIPELRIPTDYFERIGCPETRCDIFPVNHRNKLPIDEYSAIVFHGPELKRKSDESLPDKRKPHQIYVYAGIESPRPYWNNLTEYNDFFNFTMTYRLDSDSRWDFFVIRDYGTNMMVAPSKRVKWLPPEINFFDQKLLDQTKNKIKDLIWVVSHCDAPSKRDYLFNELREGIDVERFGNCENRKCNPDDCDHYDQKYRFYAAFENTLCLDWVTERSYKALHMDIVPIVYGGANYSFFIPLKSYINANDFSNVAELIKYLKILAEHPEEYLKYFWWKKYYSIEAFKEPFCNLCQRLVREQTQQRKKVYKNMTKWWNHENCQSYPKIKFRNL